MLWYYIRALWIETVPDERKIYMSSLLWYHYALGAVLILASIVIVVTVMLQQSQQQGLSGAIAGGSDSFFEKNKGRTMEAKLAKITKLFTVIFFVAVFAAVIVFRLTQA